MILLDFDHFSDLLFKSFPALLEGEYEGGEDVEQGVGEGAVSCSEEGAC